MVSAMRYVVAESFDRKELRRVFFADIPPRIGATLRLKSGKAYRIIDIEYYNSDLRGTFVQGALKRLK